jgi:hypothetical protein
MRIFLGALLLILTLPIAAQATSSHAGESIFRDGMLPSGKPLIGAREAGIRVEGAGAACATCHRRSGFGTAEGAILIPPITGRYLFRSDGARIEDVDYLHVAQGFKPSRQAYSEATVAQAIRNGVGHDGRPLNFLMPRYNLDDRDMAELIAYLKPLSADNAPGVTGDTLHFATVITPDADPIKRQGMLSVLDRFFADKNEFVRGGERPMHSGRGVKYRVSRKWQLHVWELVGTPDTWQQQLQRHLAAEPVFAVISGIGGRTWEPVQRFCESEAIPCLFPNVDLPVVAEDDFYTAYLSKGVLLEAQLIAGHIAVSTTTAAHRQVMQIYRKGDIGEAAAAALRATPANTVMEMAEQPLVGTTGSVTAQQWAATIGRLGAGDVLVLWLRAQDLKALPTLPPSGVQVFVSGIMGELENSPLPAAWRDVARLTYPFDLPESRSVRMNFPLGWFKVRNIPVIAERVQSDTYLACGILSENLNDMLDSFVRDYLLERIEVMLSRKLTSAYYPRLSLAQHQRFASKGGYLARFANAEGTHLVADGQWMVP